MKKGFTLIELLAVIVILAIIALIATPIVINIINDSKKESINRSIELYLDHVQKMVAKEQMKDPTFNPSECEINEGNLTCDGKPIQIEMKGQIPKSGTIKFSKGMVIEGVNLELDGLFYQMSNGTISNGTTEKEISYSDYITKVSDADNDGKVSPGDEYTYQVNNNDTFTFYVLSVEGDKVNLIMDRNICNDGSITYTSTNNYCRYAWHAGQNDNYYGPTTVMAELYAGTKDWDNVPDMIMNYTDENNGTTDKGYTSIITSNGVTTITGKPESNTTTLGTSAKPLKARLPKYSEINEAGCTTGTGDGSCPTWLMENMTYWNVSNDKYSMNNNGEAYQNQIYGYWLLSSDPGYYSSAPYVVFYGFVRSDGTSYVFCGARPVITVSTSDLSN